MSMTISRSLLLPAVRPANCVLFPASRLRAVGEVVGGALVRFVRGGRALRRSAGGAGDLERAARAADAVKPTLPSPRGSPWPAFIGRPRPKGFETAADAWIAEVWAAWRRHHALAEAVARLLARGWRTWSVS
jgi:hypothetical protein